MNATRWILLAIASALAVTSLAAHPGAAATLPTPNFAVSPSGHRLALDPGPFIAANTTNGDFLVVWTQEDLEAGRPLVGNRAIIGAFVSHREIIGQLVTAGGVRGNPISVTSESIALAVAFNSTAREYLVAYSRNALNIRLFGRRVGADGTLLGSEVTLVATPDGDPTVRDVTVSAAIAYNSLANEFLVAWRSVDGLFLQRLDALGTPIGGSTLLTSAVASVRPGITFNPATNQYFVTWGGVTSGTDLTTTIFGQLIASTGAPAGAAFGVSTRRLAGGPTVALDSTANRYLVVWSDERNREEEPGIFGRLVGATGTLLGDELVISTVPVFQRSPQAAYDPVAHVHLVVWEAVGTATQGPAVGRSSILGQLLDADGSRRGESFAVAESDRARGPALAADQQGGTFTAVWRHALSPGIAANDQIFAQALAGSSVPSTPALERLVFDLFLNVLARPPAQSDVLGGAAFVRANPTPAGVAALLHAFFDSNEFTGRALSMPERVRLLYEFVLGREPSDAEVAAWVSLIAARLAAIAAPPGAIGDLRSEAAMRRALATTGADVADRFFVAGLGRLPTDRERSAWAEALKPPAGAPADFAFAPSVLVGSPEFVAISRTLGGYVEVLYRMFLARDPAASERDAWVSIMLDEVRPVLAAFAGSPEFRAAVADVRNPQSIAPVVTRFYEQLLGRSPAPPERDAWVAYVTTTADLLGLANGFFRSPEYLATARTLAQHVTVLYRAFLAREPSAIERSAWVAVLFARLFSVLPAFANSTEYANVLLANTLYRTVLARPPTDGEVSSAATFLLATGDASALVRAFLASAEFAARRLSLQDSMGVVSAAVPFPLATAIFDIQRVQAGFQQQQSAILDAFVASPEFGPRAQHLLQ